LVFEPETGHSIDSDGVPFLFDQWVNSSECHIECKAYMSAAKHLAKAAGLLPITALYYNSFDLSKRSIHSYRHFRLISGNHNIL
jgi:hypothetical protein